MLARTRGFSGSVNLVVSVKLCSDNLCCHGNEHLEISTENSPFVVIWKLPLPEIGGVSDKHPHDSDHAECIFHFGEIVHVHPYAKFEVCSFTRFGDMSEGVPNFTKVT